MKIRWDSIVTGLLVGCALATTAMVFRQQVFLPNALSGSGVVKNEPTFHENWRQLISYGIRMGPPDARTQIIEFADFECPYCAKMHFTLSELQGRFPTEVAVTFIHYPLENHRYAEIAARAAECAHDQGHFEAMHNALFQSQKELGVKPWVDIAVMAGIPDTTAFNDCMADPSPRKRVADGKRLAQELNVLGTPTIIINGLQLRAPPTLEKLESMVARIAAGKRPLDDNS